MHDRCQQNRHSLSFVSVKLHPLTISLYLFLLATPTYDACKPNLMRLRSTSAPKSMSLLNIC
jgi:hypothetical protein